MSVPIDHAPKPMATEPHVPASTQLVEINVRMILVSVLLAAALGGANAYLGLFAGMTVSAAIPASVLAMAAFKILGGGNILQCNGVQTAASAGESVAAGAIFTLPALILLGAWERFDYLQTTMICALGGLLGVLFTVPLRRALIIEQPLVFPEGVATAEVLKAGERGGGGAWLIAAAGAIGAVFKIATSGLKLIPEAAGKAFVVGGSPAYVGTALSPALLGVGYIVGLNAAIVIFLGGALNALVAVPMWAAFNDIPAAAYADVPPDGDFAGAAFGFVRGAYTRYIGVGTMLVGGLWALVKLRKPLARGIASGMEAYRKRRSGEGGDVPRTERDMPMNIIVILALIAAIPVFFLFRHFTGSIGISAAMTGFVLIAGFLFSAVAAYMAGLVGSSNNPISGVTIATVLTASLLLVALGMHGVAGPIAAILVGAVVACAAAIGGDNMQDLKAGHVLGSTPYKLQIMQILGAVVGALVMAPVLNLLHTSYVIGSDKLAAPQAGLMASVSHGVFEGGLPWLMIGIGAAIAIAVIVLDLVLEQRKAEFRIPVMALAVGIYLPFDLTLPIFLGGMVAWTMKRTFARTGVTAADGEVRERNGLLFAAGLITGEALMGIILAVPIGIKEDTEVMALLNPANHEWLKLPGLLALGAVGYFMYRVCIARPKPPTPESGTSD
jgi:putative OPT family oligopeptide transporter